MKFIGQLIQVIGMLLFVFVSILLWSGQWVITKGTPADGYALIACLILSGHCLESLQKE